MHLLRHSRSYLACAVLALAAVPALATPITYTATLLGSNEVPANSSAGTGFATLILDGNLLTIDVTFSGISAPAAAAHIHCCAPLGTNAPVVVPFAGFPNATSGSYSNTIDLSTFVFSGGGSEAALINGFNTSQTYVNIHDSLYPAGEIRGQVAAVTPEPGSLLLLSTGILAAAGTTRRRWLSSRS